MLPIKQWEWEKCRICSSRELPIAADVLPVLLPVIRFCEHRRMDNWERIVSHIEAIEVVR